MKNSVLLLASVALAVVSVPSAFAGNINTGGAKGAYHTVYCPPLKDALSKAYFN